MAGKSNNSAGLGELTAEEIAARLNAHLRRWEADKKINAKDKGGCGSYYQAGAHAMHKNSVNVRYIAYSGGAGAG